jgi:uncharacterized protein (TIRG00374 family)
MSCAVLERTAVLPDLPAAPDLVVTTQPVEASPRRRAVPWQLVAVVGTVAAAGWWAVHNADTLRRATAVLSTMHLGWLLAAGLAAAATWVCSGVSQQGAVAARLPKRELIATQLAGTFTNQFTPAGLGGGAVNVRFLVRRGSTPAQAIAAVGLTQVAGVLMHFLLLAGVLVVGPDLPTSSPLHVSGTPGWLVLALFVAAPVVVAVAVAVRHWLVDRLRTLLAQTVAATAHLRRPRRVAELLMGSAGLTLAHILVLYGVLRALGTNPPLLTVAAAYLLATTASALLPTPGGIGSLDAALGVLLFGCGVTSATAIAAVLAYRLLTSWLALGPSALTLHVLVRKGIV